MHSWLLCSALEDGIGHMLSNIFIRCFFFFFLQLLHSSLPSPGIYPSIIYAQQWSE